MSRCLFLRWSLALAVGVLLAACGGEREPATPRWLPLAQDFRPADLSTLAQRWEEAAGRGDSKVGREAQGVVVARRVRAADWQGEGERRTLALAGGAFAQFARGLRLELAGRTPPARPAHGAEELAPGEYRYADGVLELRTHPDWQGTGEGLVRARGEDGRVVEGGWQARLGPHCALGIPLWSGAREELTLDLPAQSELRFRFGFDAARACELRLTLTLDGTALFDQRRTLAPQEIASFTVTLPPAARPAARLAFALEGPPGMGVVFTPVLAPRARGTPDARPWGTPRPDLVLVLVDTLRADMLAAGGGDPALAPRLNEFAAHARRFSEARSNAAWTLPSIATLLTGVYTGQHGAGDENSVLPSEVTTVVEALARAGYRTGAITDANFVSPVHGLDQGFEWFSEHYPAEDWDAWPGPVPGQWSLAQTLAEARAFLAADDGRPTFLFVHTYRVHEPYRVGPDEDPRANRAVIARAAEAAGVTDPPPDVGRRIMMGFMPELRAQYEAGVRDLDTKLGAFLEELEGARFFERGHLVLTSDHGEALGENGDFGHGNHLWEIKLRVPLLLRGPGLAAEDVTLPATLVDLAPTLAELAGLARDPRWVGTSLLTLDESRPSFAWQLGAKSHQVALRAGTRKIITTPEAEALRAGRCEEAFDLAGDPGEEQNLARALPWPAELTRAHAEQILSALLGPRAASLQLSPERQHELGQLGYGGAAAPDEPARPR